MWWILIIFGIIFYIAIIYIDVSNETTENVNFHDGGFLGLGFTTCDHRDATPQDVRRALIWPIRGFWWFTKTSIWIFAESIHGVLLIFNYRFRESNIYKKIETWNFK